MKKIKKISLKKQDYNVLNDSKMSKLKGGERTSLYCKLGNKIWQCMQLELNCPSGFTTGSCGALNTSCPSNFSTTTF